jgi:cytochrome c oxidase subunit II
MRRKINAGIGRSMMAPLLLVAISLARLDSRAAGTEEDPAPASGAISTLGATQAVGKAEQELSGKLEDGVRVVKVRAKRFEYIPGTIVVNEGEKVRLEITSEDTTHGFGLSEYKIRLTLEPGKTQKAEFTAGKPGTYGFHCIVFCGMGHMKMRGELVVRPAPAAPRTS